MNLRTPLARAKGLGSAHSGSHHWLMQRISAIILAVLFIWFAFSFACLLGMDYLNVKIWISKSYNLVLLITFLGAAFYHAILGLQVVLEDYILQSAKKIGMIIAMKIILTVLGLASIIAVLRAGLGA